MNKNQIAQSPVQERAKDYLKENETLLKKYNLVFRPIVFFPRNGKEPLLSRIALWIVEKQGGGLDIQFGERKKQ